MLAIISTVIFNRKELYNYDAERDLLAIAKLLLILNHSHNIGLTTVVVYVISSMSISR